nr:putative ribonuclease H-like domain-containing protein [Tanacetum cinerariifolium]
MTCNISYLSEYEPYDGGYVSFGQGRGKITGKDFKLKDDTNVLLRTPRQHHMRLGHLNFKTMNKLVRNNLVKGLPSKCFENDHTCVACLKGKQHKASCKTKTKDETSGILRNFITKIENLNDLKVKIIRCDNGGEFKNKEMNEFCTKKGIKREFSNARTPHQNGVAERRNRTLIEAARTITPAIGFLRPFRCHVMILNTLDHLGKFDAKGDEDFLENKLIEKGAGPNWLFDIDTLTNSMNYVSVVVAGTSSTNISGTKDVASQGVKKNVSSLRYIALPNWFHEAHMESSHSDAQDACNVDVSESSGISNPTATSKIPPAKQMESLTVESKFPTVSSHVPTVFLDTSPETSSGLRLISKEVISQEETPSLDNALTLSNWFEDTIKVEADLSNMESSYQLEEGIDYEEVFAPVAKIEAIRLFLAYASFIGFTVYQMDVKSAFLYGTIDEEVYVMQPPGFQDPEFPDRVYKVEKEIHCLSESTKENSYLFKFLQKKDGIFLPQDKYVGDILKMFGYSDVRSANTPMDKENPWGKDGLGKDVELYLYRSMIRSLMYLIASRPDIMFAICACARHQVTPKECHLHTVKRIFRYLKGHPMLGLWYPKESPFDLVTYSDSDYGGATQDKKSTTGGCQFLGRRLISWQCKKQTIVATSTTEAEYVAAASGYRQVLWIQNQMLDYGRNDHT